MSFLFGDFLLFKGPFLFYKVGGWWDLGGGGHANTGLKGGPSQKNGGKGGARAIF